MKINIKTDAYNERRYGKPYIGVLGDDGRVLRWGDWVGTPGDAGFLEVEADTGAAIITGQKDNRGSNDTPKYTLVEPDATLRYGSKAEIIMAARAARANPKHNLDDTEMGMMVAALGQALAYGEINEAKRIQSLMADWINAEAPARRSMYSEFRNEGPANAGLDAT